MIALYLLASHLVGDFIFQTRWQAVSKFTDRRARLIHCTTYGAAFAPVLAYYGDTRLNGLLIGPRALGFMVGLVVLHFVTDSRRFRSTLGDVVQWKLDYRRDPRACAETWLEQEIRDALARGPESSGWIGLARERVLEIDTSWPPPNPWPACPLMIDQTLHIVEIAVLAAVFLR